MPHRVFTVGVNDDVYIRQDQALCSIRASNAVELFKSIPGRTPCPSMVVSRKNGCRATRGLGALLSRNVSSMRCDQPQPCSCASFGLGKQGFI